MKQDTQTRGGFKRLNEYADALGPLYAKIPKAVFAACAVSYFINSGDEPIAALLNEWQCLYNSGVVPQRPPRNK